MDAKLVIDLGNSETRLLVAFTDNEGTKRHIISRLDNKYKVMPFGVEGLLDKFEGFTPDTTYAYYADDMVICMGLYATTNYAMLEQPTTTLKKHQNHTTRWAIPAVFMRAYEILAEAMGTTIDNLDTVYWTVVVCLPAQELEVGKEPTTDMFKNTNKVDMLFPSRTFEIHCTNAKIVPEGFSSLVACAFDENRTPIDTTLLSGYTLVIDIGEGTTDLCVTRNGTIMKESLYTITYGGRDLLRNVRNAVVTKGFREQSDHFYEMVTRQGYYQLSNGTILDFSKDVARLRADLTRKVCIELTKFFENMQFSLTDLDHIVIVGGGAVDKSENSMYTIVKDYLVSLLEKSDSIVDPITHKVELYSPEKGLTMERPDDYYRLLNVIGADIYSQ